MKTMRIEFASIQPQQGWKKFVQSNCLVIERDEEFDLFKFMDTPRFVARLHVRQDGTTEVDTDEFSAYNTSDKLEKAIVL